MNRDQQTEALLAQAQEESGGDPSPLLLAMLGLSDRLKRSRTRELLFRGLILAVLAIGFISYRGNEDRINDIEAVRLNSRIASCEQDNIRIVQHNDLVRGVENILLLVTTSNTTRTPEQQQRVDEFLTRATGELEKSIVPLRDCSPAGVEAYLTPSTTVPQ